MKLHRIRRLLPASCLCVLFSAGLNALESDKRQGIEFNSAGGAKMNITGEIRTVEMNTNVSVIQGTLQIKGDQAIIEYKAATNELIRVTVHGSPVQYQQQLDEAGSMVTGTSDTLLLYTETSTDQTLLELIGGATINTPDSSMKCASIVYLADENIIREAPGPCEGVFNSQSN